MRHRMLCSLLLGAVVSWAGIAVAAEVVLPAGTLLTCILDEPSFSSATVTVGDPFLCHTRPTQMFGQSVFPRGAYLVGRLQADKDPGHFVGKGWLQLTFDRIGLVDTDVPLSAKVIAVQGYKVNREGKIIGRGHATRDTVEWMLPPLWPWKVLTLPARGPRPTLKGEVAVTVRLMDDVTLPSGRALNNRFGEPGASLAPPRLPSHPISPTAVSDAVAHPDDTGCAEGFSRTSQGEAAGACQSGWRHFGDPKITLFVTRHGSVYAVTQYRRDADFLALILTSGVPVSVDLRDMDWATTFRINRERGVSVSLSSPLCNGPCAGN